MSIWDRFLHLIGLRPTPDPRKYHVEISDNLKVTLSTIAKDEGRPESELIPELLNAGLTQYTSSERLWNKWQTLSLREKDVVAFVCLGYTNQEIALRMNISPNTVKDRLSSVFRKFNIHRRNDLRMLFSLWDFNEWERQG
jgi:DNA-binding CsgD family transcriptional regulator